MHFWFYLCNVVKSYFFSGVIAAFPRFQNAINATAESGQSGGVASSILCTSLLSRSWEAVVLPDQDAPCGAKPWWDEAFPEMCLKSRRLPGLSDMCQKSPGWEGCCQLRLKPRRLPALSLVLDSSRLTERHQRLSSAVGLPDERHHRWNMSLKVCHTWWDVGAPERRVSF